MFKALGFSVAYIEDAYNVNTDVFNRLVPTKLKKSIQRYSLNIPSGVFRK